MPRLFKKKQESVIVKGIYGQMFEHSDTLGERRGQGVDPAEFRNSVDLRLKNACIDRLSDRDPNSATDNPE